MRNARWWWSAVALAAACARCDDEPAHGADCTATPVRGACVAAAVTGGESTVVSSGCAFPPGAELAGAVVPEGYCTWVWAAGLSSPRGIAAAPGGDVLVVERGRSQVTALFDADGDGVSGVGERAVLAQAAGLNHGVAVQAGALYASSSSTVYRWPYPAGARADLGQPAVIVRDIPSGGHSTRTLAFDAEGRLYVSVGSGSNVDSDSSRARIRRFSAAQVACGGVAFEQGEVFADGLRNEVGLAFDSSGRLWGVENGVDNLYRDDLGGDIHQGNPAEELNRFDEPGRFYGYPFCWSEYLLPVGAGLGPLTQWAHPSFLGDGTHTDEWCRDPANVFPPLLGLPAHTAPLDIIFYHGGAFPADVQSDAFVTMHGSWNADPPVGYRVVRLDLDAQGQPQGLVPFLSYAGPGQTGAPWPHRPVGLAVDAAGRLLVTSDASGVVIAIGHQ